MDLAKKSIGIWGFGVVGKSAAQYLSTTGARLSIIDKRSLTEQEQTLVKQLAASHEIISDPEQIKNWLSTHDYIIASPGIDLRPFAEYSNKFIAELDLFYHAFKNPIVAVTGSVGKTTVTHLLSQLLVSRYPHLWTGGNIGTGMLDAIHSHKADAALLELSSFQLEPCQHFAPDLAVWTNIHPNHLDRHGSMEAYINAKRQILAHQTTKQHALIPLALKEYTQDSAATIHYFSVHEEPVILSASSSFYCIRQDSIIKRTARGEQCIGLLSDVPAITFPENILIIVAALDLAGISLASISDRLAAITVPAHRLELITTIDEISFYNDSKATTAAATMAAVHKLRHNHRPVILMLGGLGKGVDRTPLVEALKSEVAHIYCFGKERNLLAEACQSSAIPHTTCETIDDVIADYWPRASKGDQLLLSPSGSSYDQFKDYEERGNYFKACVRKLMSL
jgi:UDP-N-acetylmuramoylalanine--D-glutamate ligase